MRLHVEHAIKEWEEKLKDGNLVISLPRLQSSWLYSNATRCVGIQHRLLPLQLVMNSTAALLIIEVNSATSLRSYDCFTGWMQRSVLTSRLLFFYINVYTRISATLPRSFGGHARSKSFSFCRSSVELALSPISSFQLPDLALNLEHCLDSHVNYTWLFFSFLLSFEMPVHAYSISVILLFASVSIEHECSNTIE
jgi:hypothetical protein